MKTTAQSLAMAPAAAQSWLAVFGELVKARLTFLVLLTTLVGFYIGTRELMDYTLLVHTLFGTALMACGASALNQLAEREHDARMRRTESRPLPSGRLQPETVLIFGGVCSVAGLLYLALAVNLLTSLIGAFTLVTYVFLYTPLKRVTWLNTAVGAVPAAIDGLDGGAERADGRRLVVVRDPFLLANPAFSGDRLDVSRGISEGGFCHAAVD